MMISEGIQVEGVREGEGGHDEGKEVWSSPAGQVSSEQRLAEYL